MRLPRVQFTLRSIMAVVVVAALVLVVARNADRLGWITEKLVINAVAGVVAVVYGAGAVRRPVTFLLPLIAAWILISQADHRTRDMVNGPAMVCFMAWVVGTSAGCTFRWLERGRRSRRASSEPSERG